METESACELSGSLGRSEKVLAQKMYRSIFSDMSDRLVSLPQHFADILPVNTHMLVRPTDESVELAFAVKGVHALAVEVIFLHLPDDADGLLPHGLNFIAAAVTR
jgi:hypothetical protein